MQDNILSKVISITQEFIDILVEETTLIREHKLNEAMKLLATKQILLHEQNKFISQIVSYDFQEEEIEQRDEFISLLETLGQALEENHKVLDAAHRVQQYLINVIIDAVKHQQAPNCVYNKDKRHGTNTAPVSISHLNLAL